MGRRAGYSLLELMLALFIVALAVAMGFAVARGARGHMSVRQVAQKLLADLRWARQQAMTRGVPAGVLLPGATVAGQAYDVVEADVETPGAIRVVRTEDWSSDGHYAFLAVGTWGGLPFQSTDAPFSGRQDASTQSLLTQVSEAWPGRYVMFGPSGSVVTSGIPSANGEHYLVVTAGLRESGGNLDAVWGGANLRNIFVANTDGSGPALQVTHYPPTGGDFNPGVMGWSPDGSRILYLPSGSRHVKSPDMNNRSDLCVVNADGTGGETDLTPATPHYYGSAAWSSDGSRIVSEVVPLGAFGGGTGVGDIYIMRADGSNETALTTDHASHEPDWRR